jgi:hypothetical protein
MIPIPPTLWGCPYYRGILEKYHKSPNSDRFLQCGYLICKEKDENKILGRKSPHLKGICGR